VPLSVGEERENSNTMRPRPSPTSVPSGILIHPTVWPQYTNVTDRQTGQWSHNIGRTVTCNSRQTYHVSWSKDKVCYLEGVSSKESASQQSSCLDSNRSQLWPTLHDVSNSVDVRTRCALIVSTDHIARPISTHAESRHLLLLIIYTTINTTSVGNGSSVGE